MLVKFSRVEIGLIITATAVVLLENLRIDIPSCSHREGQVGRSPSFKEALASIESMLYSGGILRVSGPWLMMLQC